VTVDDALHPVTALVPHLRWRVGPPAADDLIGESLADAEVVAEAVAASAAGRGTGDPQVLGSLWWQAYCYRVAGTTLAAWALAEGAPDPGARGAGVGIARSRPSSLLVDPSAPLVRDLEELIDRLFGGHLDRVAEALRGRHALGTRLLWGNAAAGIASALGAVGTADGAPPLRARLDVVLGALPHDLAALGTWQPGLWSFRRRTCCLWWKTPASRGALCEDCSLR